MRRLDARNYGHCLGCGTPIGFARLAQTPEEITCEGCRTDASVSESSSDVTVA